MSGLVGYDSSDEDEEMQERPAKVAKTVINRPVQDELPSDGLSSVNPTRQVAQDQESESESLQPQVLEPAPGPEPMDSSYRDPNVSLQPTHPQESSATSTPPASPYTATRNLLHSLTMPTIPNFDIPPSPPRSSSPTTATALAASTKQFNRFLDLKRKGVHFNARLNSSSSLRNPSLLPKLMDYAGVNEEDGRMTTLSEEAGGVPVTWREEVYVESLLKENERWRKKRLKEREKVEFVGSRRGVEGSEGRDQTG